EQARLEQARLEQARLEQAQLEQARLKKLGNLNLVRTVETPEEKPVFKSPIIDGNAITNGETILEDKSDEGEVRTKRNIKPKTNTLVRC
ncbi:hypothetical protein KAT92_04690, partial [Candidatus Babeliales bacterium]|nr:hypothetical protein [Candidatus Babeliales bacterium]